ncbi:uncharacterized protein LOC124927518 [Impatiens glandulifera]|uniref:uncharacterized protein LOC124927518 n=1 Tax=Impatiens glandulifera TaxID=253017 RepID=UPI001FB0DD0E|nr:uncharacterized protein LOC124927518 [Impatiens glandulifera]
MAHLGCLTSVPDPHIKLCYKSAEAKKETKSNHHNDIEPEETSISKWGRPVEEDTTMWRNRLNLIEIPTEDALEMEINHFSHEHPLILSYNKHDREKSCYGCFEKMKVSIAYTCSVNKCYFNGLHKWCGNLPTQIRHPLHPKHPLSLLKSAPNNIDLCIACQDRLFSDTFVYSCKLCYVNIHAMCAFIPTNLNSQVHDHPLHLWKTNPRYPVLCNVCGFDSEATHFVCESCDFVADFTCAMMPRNVTNDCHVHTLALTNVIAQEDETEFICDACEKTRNGFSWVYYCADCEYSSHTECALYKRRPNDFDLHEHVLSVINSSLPSS